jgi:hypothetical protein
VERTCARFVDEAATRCDDAEDRGIGSYAERQREDCHQRQAGTLEERPNRVSQIGQHGCRGFRESLAAERDDRIDSRGVAGGHSVRSAVIGSMRVARRAGTAQAMAATPAETAAAPMVTESDGETSKSTPGSVPATCGAWVP